MVGQACGAVVVEKEINPQTWCIAPLRLSERKGNCVGRQEVLRRRSATTHRQRTSDCLMESTHDRSLSWNLRIIRLPVCLSRRVWWRRNSPRPCTCVATRALNCLLLFFVLGLTQRVTSLSHAFANISYLIVTKGKLVMCYGRDRLNT